MNIEINEINTSKGDDVKKYVKDIPTYIYHGFKLRCK